MDRSKLTILFILLVALGSGVYAWWHQYRQSGQVLDLWGSKAIVLARDAPGVELLELTARPAAANAPDATQQASDSRVIEIDSQTLDVTKRFDISTARGLIHARHALIDAASFDWTASSDCRPAYSQAIQFSDDRSIATFVLDLDCRSIRLLERDREATLTEFAAAALKKYLSELSDQRPRNQVGK